MVLGSNGIFWKDGKKWQSWKHQNYRSCTWVTNASITASMNDVWQWMCRKEFFFFHSFSIFKWKQNVGQIFVSCLLMACTYHHSHKRATQTHTPTPLQRRRSTTIHRYQQKQNGCSMFHCVTWITELSLRPIKLWWLSFFIFSFSLPAVRLRNNLIIIMQLVNKFIPTKFFVIRLRMRQGQFCVC